jgi:hypothetical protein
LTGCGGEGKLTRVVNVTKEKTEAVKEVALGAGKGRAVETGEAMQHGDTTTK